MGKYSDVCVLMIFLLWSISVPAMGQDVIFSQFLENSLAVNPAFTGVSGNAEVFSIYRQERFGNSVRFETYSVSYQQPSELLHGGFGVEIFRDAATRGFIAKNAVSLFYAYHLRLSRSWNVSSGFQTSFVQKKLNTNGMILPDMIDPVRGVVLASAQTIDPWSRFYFDFQVGFLIYDKHWFTSLSAFHLMEPQESGVKIPETILKRRYTIVVGRSFNLKSLSSTFGQLKIIPWGGAFYQSGKMLLRTGFSGYLGPLSAGLGWQGGMAGNSQIIIPSVGFVTKFLRITYNYNIFAGGKIAGEVKNIHEISFKYFINRETLFVLPFTINLTGF